MPRRGTGVKARAPAALRRADRGRNQGSAVGAGARHSMDLTFSHAMEMLVALRDQTSAAAPNEPLRFLNHCLTHVAKSSSQFLQDLWVDYELRSRTGGFFVEFGACDGVWASNTHFLETHRGW